MRFIPVYNLSHVDLSEKAGNNTGWRNSAYPAKVVNTAFFLINIPKRIALVVKPTERLAKSLAFLYWPLSLNAYACIVFLTRRGSEAKVAYIVPCEVCVLGTPSSYNYRGQGKTNSHTKHKHGMEQNRDTI